MAKKKNLLENYSIFMNNDLKSELYWMQIEDLGYRECKFTEGEWTIEFMGTTNTYKFRIGDKDDDKIWTIYEVIDDLIRRFWCKDEAIPYYLTFLNINKREKKIFVKFDTERCEMSSEQIKHYIIYRIRSAESSLSLDVEKFYRWDSVGEVINFLNNGVNLLLNEMIDGGGKDGGPVDYSEKWLHTIKEKLTEDDYNEVISWYKDFYNKVQTKITEHIEYMEASAA